MKNDQFEDINYDIVSNAKQILNFAESQYLQTGQLEPLSEQVASQLAKLTLKQFYKALDELQLSTPVIENVFSQIRNNKNITPDEPEELIPQHLKSSTRKSILPVFKKESHCVLELLLSIQEKLATGETSTEMRNQLDQICKSIRDTKLAPLDRNASVTEIKQYVEDLIEFFKKQVSSDFSYIIQRWILIQGFFYMTPITPKAASVLQQELIISLSGRDKGISMGRILMSVFFGIKAKISSLASLLNLKDDGDFKGKSDVVIVDEKSFLKLKNRFDTIRNVIATKQLESFVEEVNSEVSDQMKPLGVTYALFDFDGEKDDELSFRAGDEITVYEQYEDGWWYGCTNGRWGLFPENYCDSLHVTESKEKVETQSNEPKKSVEEKPSNPVEEDSDAEDMEEVERLVAECKSKIDKISKPLSTEEQELYQRFQQWVKAMKSATPIKKQLENIQPPILNVRVHSRLSAKFIPTIYNVVKMTESQLSVSREELGDKDKEITPIESEEKPTSEETITESSPKPTETEQPKEETPTEEPETPTKKKVKTFGMGMGAVNIKELSERAKLKSEKKQIPKPTDIKQSPEQKSPNWMEEMRKKRTVPQPVVKPAEKKEESTKPPWLIEFEKRKAARK